MFYDILYSTGENIPEQILDDLDAAKKWYKKWKEKYRKKDGSDSDYSNYQHVFRNK